MIIAVVGFSGVGKTTFLNRLYNELCSRGVKFFIQTANPDQEGRWTSESPVGKELARKHKKVVTQPFSREFVEWVKTSALNLNKLFDYVFLDCGGKQSSENAEFLRISDGVIIIGRSVDEILSWLKFAREANPEIAVVATYLSILEGDKLVFKQINLDKVLRETREKPKVKEKVKLKIPSTL